MKRVRRVEAIILGIATAMTICGIIPPKKFLCIFFVIILISVISEWYYFKKYSQAFVEILSEYYAFKYMKKDRDKQCFTKYDENMFNMMTYIMINTGKRSVEKGTVFTNNSHMSPERRKEVQEIMDEINQIMKQEKS